MRRVSNYCATSFANNKSSKTILSKMKFLSPFL
jgi:hypothetical protein